MKTTTKFISILSVVLAALQFASCGKKTFRDYAAKKNLQIGIAIPPGDIYGEKESAILKENASLLVCENAMKWQNVRPKKNYWNWGDIDAMVKFAEENKMEVKWHVLFWHNQNPPFLNDMKTKEDALSMMDEHIETIMTRYKGKIKTYEVANEMFEENGSWRETIWYKLIGPEYIEHALRKAREVDPSAKIYLNDYNNEEMGKAKSEAFYELAKDLKSRGVPLDGVGFQLHISAEYYYDFDAICANIKRFAELGLEVYFTEVDIRMPLPATPEMLERQQEYYCNLVRLGVEEPNVKNIVFWGYTDKHSWIPSQFPGTGEALFYDKNFQPKPVYNAMLEVLKEK